jgi:nitrogen fixation/metabolism regulation signal transduction histidine kinase
MLTLPPLPPRPARWVLRSLSWGRLRSLPFMVALTAVASLATLGVLLFLLLVVSHNQALYERYYKTLMGVNIGAGVLLLLVISWVVFSLWRRLRKGKFGARLMLKLAFTFALVGLLPGLVMYVVSYQFVVRSIESWFDQRVEGALQAGLNLGAGTLDNLTLDLVSQARAASSDWSEVPIYGTGLDRFREQLRAEDVQVWNGQGRLLGASGTSRFELAPQGADASVLHELAGRGYTTTIEGLDDPEAAAPKAGRIHLWARLRSGSLSLNSGQGRLLHVVQIVPSDLMRNALQVQNAYREYQERALAREGLRSMYVGTLSLSLILAVFAAILLAVILSGRLMRPLLLLSEGVAKVAAGDLQGQAATARLMRAGDELGDLTQAFAQMTQQLATAQVQKRLSMLALEEAHTYLQTILDNQSSGVIVLDGQGHILSVNAGATRVLREPLAAFIGQTLAAVPNMAELADKARALFMAQADESFNADVGEHWERTFVLQDDAADPVSEHSASTGGARTILARGVLLPQRDRADAGAGDANFNPWGDAEQAALGRHLLVLDDISATVSAQRSQAWAEVARRLAHEIKNPLTPIQLSAERLEMKLQDKLQGAEAQLLHKSVATIVDQVAALKRLVDEFREYARLPAAQLQPTDLGGLLGDMAQLYAHAVVPVQWQVPPDLPAIMGDAQQLRQVVHNLVQNAQDAALSRYEADCVQSGAGAGAGSAVDMADIKPAQVQVQAQLSSSGERLRLLVRDNGSGFPAAILQRAFEPYITTKAKGTGLGLAVVKKIADEHHARLEINNLLPPEDANAKDGAKTPEIQGSKALGAQISLSFALAKSVAASA